MTPAEDLADALDIPPETGARIMRNVVRGLLEYVYPVPSECDTQEQWQRRTHHDLPTFSLAQLLLERDRLELRLKIDRKPHAWLLERHAQIQEAIRHAR
jgi:hypothetical protein